MSNAQPTTKQQSKFDDETVQNLAGFLDVLVQMDQTLKEQERKRDESN